ncbi:MAG: sulfatase [Sedimentisphaerales bacterium]|nr:sulfatase [Sedimentisphaerales bacterium]
MKKPLSRRQFLQTATVASISLGMGIKSISAQEHSSQKKPNVLFIAVDDLRPELACFGRKEVISPNLDRLAAEGVIFSRCYCQVPVCGASRASLLTGVRPKRDRFVGFDTWADKDLPGNLSLPRHFHTHGYTTLSLGKIYHHQTDGAGSWSRPAWRPKGQGNWRDYQLAASRAIAADRAAGKGPAFEAAEVSDETYFDGKIANQAIAELQRLKGNGASFFLGVGFLKPHLPFNAPKKYWDLYNRRDIDLADNPFAPRGAPRSALHNWGELRAYDGIPAKGPLSEEMARTLVHGYYACVSYTDAQIGRILDELERLGLKDNTIVVLWGDHGWNLGEHGLWCKHCNFETSLRSPLMIRVPGVKGGSECEALTEFVDIYPSLCELCGLDVPEHTEGLSFVPLLANPTRPWKKAAFSRYYAGDSVRTSRYRYTYWLDKQGNRFEHMLYDHVTDPGENVNVADLPENAGTVAWLSGLLRKGYRTGLPDR